MNALRNALSRGHRLHCYEIDSVLGEGDFGITYLAYDSNLDQPVAIREFLPSDLVTRTQDSAVYPRSGDHLDHGQSRFVQKFSHIEDNFLLGAGRLVLVLPGHMSSHFLRPRL